MKWKRISESLYLFEKFLIIFSGIGMLVVTFINVILRYLFATNMTWASELATYLLVLTVYVGVGISIRNENEVKLTLLQNLSPIYARISLVAATLIGIFACFIFIFFGYKTVGFLQKIHMKTAGLNIPSTIPYSIVIFGGCLSMVRYLEKLYNICRQPASNDKKRQEDIILPL